MNRWPLIVSRFDVTDVCDLCHGTYGKLICVERRKYAGMAASWSRNMPPVPTYEFSLLMCHGCAHSAMVGLISTMTEA